MSSIYHNMVFSIEIEGLPSRLVDITVESGTRDNHVLCDSEGYQYEATVACFLVQTEFPDCLAKKDFSPTFALKSPIKILISDLLYRTSSLS